MLYSLHGIDKCAAFRKGNSSHSPSALTSALLLVPWNLLGLSLSPGEVLAPPAAPLIPHIAG